LQEELERARRALREIFTRAVRLAGGPASGSRDYRRMLARQIARLAMRGLGRDRPRRRTPRRAK